MVASKLASFFNPFGQSPAPANEAGQEGKEGDNDGKPEVEDSKGGFDREALEEGLRLLEKLILHSKQAENSGSSYKVLEVYESSRAVLFQSRRALKLVFACCISSKFANLSPSQQSHGYN